MTCFITIITNQINEVVLYLAKNWYLYIKKAINWRELMEWDLHFRNNKKLKGIFIPKCYILCAF